MKEIVKKTKSGDAVGLYIYGVKLAFLWMWWIIKGIASTYQELERNKPQSGFYTYLIIFLIFWNYGAITLMYAAIMKPLPIEKIIVSTLIAISSMIALIFSTIKLCRLQLQYGYFSIYLIVSSTPQQRQFQVHFFVKTIGKVAFQDHYRR